MAEERDCFDCDGQGVMVDEDDHEWECDSCGGSGIYDEEEE